MLLSVEAGIYGYNAALRNGAITNSSFLTQKLADRALVTSPELPFVAGEFKFASDDDLLESAPYDSKASGFAARRYIGALSICSKRSAEGPLDVSPTAAYFRTPRRACISRAGSFILNP